MDVQGFLDNFVYVANASNGVAKLRKMVLQLAIRGQLVNQEVEDEKASELLVSIKKYKKHLVEANMIRKTQELPAIQDHEKSFEIPESWIWVRLGDIGNWGSGSTPDRQRKDYYDGDVPWFKSGELNDGVISESEETVTELALKECSLRLNQPGDVLIAMYGASIGKAAIQRVHGTTNQAVCACTCYQGVFNWWLFFVIQAYKSRFIGIAEGGAQPNISRVKIINTVVPLPPFEEQKRIVNRIKELLVLCDEFETQQVNLRKVEQKANQSLLTALTSSDTFEDLETVWSKFELAFTDLADSSDNIEELKEAIRTLAVFGKLEEPVNNGISQKIIEESLNKKKQLIASNEIKQQKFFSAIARDEFIHAYPSQWSIARFDDLASITGGVTKGRKFKDRKTSNYPFLRVANVQRGYFLLDDIHEIEIPIDEYDRYVLKEGDVLITEGGDWDKVGRTAIWQGQLKDCLHQNHVFKARMFSERIEKEWIELIFNSSVGKQYWASASKQTTNLASINMTQVRSFPVPLPSQEEQRRILYKLKKLLAICDELIDEIKKSQEVQDKFSKAAIHSILDNEINGNVFLKDKSYKKRFKRRLNVEIILILSMGNYLINTTLAKILKLNGGKMEAKELWKASAIKNIDEFYAFLKKEIEDGFIQEPEVAELKLMETDE